MDNSRYTDDPMKMLFENFILATIGKLPKEKDSKLNSLNLAKVFNTEPKDWKLIVKYALALSDTIEIAILDLWYTNQELAAQRKIEYLPEQFAIDFANNFFVDNSMIDIWPGNSLELAIERIKLFRSREN